MLNSYWRSIQSFVIFNHSSGHNNNDCLLLQSLLLKFPMSDWKIMKWRMSIAKNYSYNKKWFINLYLLTTIRIEEMKLTRDVGVRIQNLGIILRQTVKQFQKKKRKWKFQQKSFIKSILKMNMQLSCVSFIFKCVMAVILTHDNLFPITHEINIK